MSNTMLKNVGQKSRCWQSSNVKCYSERLSNLIIEIFAKRLLENQIHFLEKVNLAMSCRKIFKKIICWCRTNVECIAETHLNFES